MRVGHITSALVSLYTNAPLTQLFVRTLVYLLHTRACYRVLLTIVDTLLSYKTLYVAIREAWDAVLKLFT